MYVGDNRDGLPTDGMGDSADYAGTAPYGTPDDPAAWFNLLPPYMATKSLSYYYDSPHLNYVTGLPDPSHPQNWMPFPGRAGSKIWFCPSAQMTDSDVTQVTGQGKQGFFAYVQNLDLNKVIGTSSSGNPLGNEPANVDTTMPKVNALPKPAATVYMFDQCFNPVTEVDNSSPSYNSVNPGDRFRSLASRHNTGAVLVFCDGHAQFFKDSYLTNHASMSGTAIECPATGPAVPDVIWNPAYRAFIGF
jgi:prepilin-type processing-associated H-X9-DG protein